MLEREFLIDLFADFGPITIRRLFSGYGISVDGTTFALSLRGALYFRVDQDSIPRFAAEGATPFTYQNHLRSVTMNSYWQVPARLFDDSEELAQWARHALAAAEAAAAKKRARKLEPGRPGSGVAKGAGTRSGTRADGKVKSRTSGFGRKAVPKKTSPKKAVPRKGIPKKTVPKSRRSKA